MKRSSICFLWENKKKYDLRFWIYFIVCVFGIILFNGMPVFASLGDFEVIDLYQKITNETKDTNDLLQKAFQFASVSPYTIMNQIDAISDFKSYVTASRFISASKTVSLVIATLLLMVDFYKKSVSFEWSSKWENILLFLIKILIVKQIVTNADVIMGYIYAGFDHITQTVTGQDSVSFLPCGDIRAYILTVPYRGDEVIEWVYSQFWHEDLHYKYEVSFDAVKIFYPDAVLPESYTATSHEQIPAPIDSPSFVPLIEYMLWIIPYFFVLKAVAIIIFVITIGRAFELLIYTMLAPLPLATFASDTSHDVAKSFLKNYIATVLQIAVILVMFIIYVAVNKYFSNTASFVGTKLIQIIELVTLCTCVFKSGSWARKVCGIG